MPKIAIIGAGVSGAYFYRMLKERRPDIRVDIFTQTVNNQCHMRSCGWVVSYPVYQSLGKNLNIDLERFIFSKFRQIEIDGKVIGADNAVINKPALIEKFLEGAALRFDTCDTDKYDRIIDATGKRVYFPPVPADKYVTIHQVRIADDARSFPAIAVRWDRNNKDMMYMIPVGDGTGHIGFGSLVAPEKSREELQKYIAGKKIVCGCSSNLWFGGPVFPLVRDKFIAVGESAGLVDPLSGMGITPAMDSAAALVKYWDSPAEYERYVKIKYSFMSRLIKARDGEPWPLRLYDLMFALKNEYTLLGFRPGMDTAMRKLSPK